MMNPAAIFGIHHLAQVFNWFSGPSPTMPAGASGNAVQKGRQIPLKVCELYLVFNFLEPKDLGRLEQVSKTFEDAVGYQWRSLCRMQLGLSPGPNLDPFLPATLSVKASVQFLLNNIFDERVYERHIGDVEPAPPISRSSFLKRYNEPDPCDPIKTIGSEYVLMYLPESVTINQSGVSLDKADDPNDSEAPRLIRREGPSSGPGAQSENTTLKVAVTINNIVELFKCPKTGNPSTFSYIWDQIEDQHGNKRMPAGWIYMRRDVIGRNLPFAQQQALANEKGVVLSELLPRILFNFLEHVGSKKAGVYPDGQDPSTYARTSTITRDSGGTNWPSGCGAGGPSGLHVYYDCIGTVNVGVAVALPAEVQAIGP